jgi:hypothetical protein
VLRRHVNARGQVDFAGIAAAPDALAEVVATVGRFGPPAGPRRRWRTTSMPTTRWPCTASCCAASRRR